MHALAPFPCSLSTDDPACRAFASLGHWLPKETLDKIHLMWFCVVLLFYWYVILPIYFLWGFK